MKRSALVAVAVVLLVAVGVGGFVLGLDRGRAEQRDIVDDCMAVVFTLRQVIEDEQVPADDVSRTYGVAADNRCPAQLDSTD